MRNNERHTSEKTGFEAMKSQATPSHGVRDGAGLGCRRVLEHQMKNLPSGHMCLPFENDNLPPLIFNEFFIVAIGVVHTKNASLRKILAQTKSNNVNFHDREHGCSIKKWRIEGKSVENIGAKTFEHEALTCWHQCQVKTRLSSGI